MLARCDTAGHRSIPGGEGSPRGGQVSGSRPCYAVPRCQPQGSRSTRDYAATTATLCQVGGCPDRAPPGQQLDVLRSVDPVALAFCGHSWSETFLMRTEILVARQRPLELLRLTPEPHMREGYEGTAKRCELKP